MANHAEACDLSELTATHLAAFNERGCMVLRGVFSPDELAAHRSALRDYILGIQAADSAALDAAPFTDRKPSTETTRSRPQSQGSTPPAYRLADAPAKVAEFITLARLGELAARFLNVEAVRVLHFCGFFKAGGAPPTPWHQDLSYIPLDTDKVISIWVPLTEITAEMAPLIFAEGSHLLHGPVDPAAAVERFPVVQSGAMRAGDVSLHLGWTLHGALKNSSPRMREAFAICYYADGARLHVRDGAPFMQSLLHGNFPGLAPGDLAVGPLNPVVFRRSSAGEAEARPAAPRREGLA